VKITRYGPVLAVGLLLAFLVTSPVHADTVYTYTGTPFTSCFGIYTCTSTGPEITIRFDTTTPLPANLPFATNITLDVFVGFGMSDGTFGLGGADNIFVDVGTDANGNINQWDIGGFPDCGPPLCEFFWNMRSSNIGGQSEDSSEVFDVDGLVGGGETLSGPGTWTVTTPEPSSLILLGAGLLGFALIGVRR
jgi:PEP-CTERM motif-containing protein